MNTTTTLTRSASGPGTIYRAMVKRAIDSHVKSAKVTSDSAVRWTNESVVVVPETAPIEAESTPPYTALITAPAPAEIVITELAAPESAPAELSPSERGEVFEVPALKFMDFIQAHPEYGYPKKGDKFQVITLDSPLYGGMSLPFQQTTLGDLYPVYLVANMSGELMRTCNDDDYLTAQKENPKRKPIIDFHYRSDATSNGNALELSLRDIKRLKQWQNMTYGKIPTESPDEIRLSVRKTDNFIFQVLTDTLKRAIKDVNKKAWIEFSGLAFPAKILQEIVKLADDTVINVTLDQAYTYQVIKWATLNKGTRQEKKVPDGLIDKTSPAIVLRHGSTKTVIYGATLATLTSNDSKALVIHCTLLG